LLEKGYGLRNLEENAPTSPQTHYRIASLTKAFTATAILQLIEQGKLSLQTKLTDLWPDFPSYGRQISLHHLLSHTSGIKDYENLIPSSFSGQVSDKDVFQILSRQKSTYFRPGTQYRYSNSAYCILSQVIERVSALSFSSYLEKYIFNPLGMDTSVAFVKGMPPIRESALGYSPKANGFVLTDQSQTSATLGDGGIYTSVRELFHWLEMWGGGLSVISEESQRLMTTAKSLKSGKKTSYGYGWSLGTLGGWKKISHTGGTIGHKHAIAYFPEKKLGLVLLVNRENASPWDTLNEISNWFLKSKT
jgi:CubicO group peptidase (beta-lactamase class C family)